MSRAVSVSFRTLRSGPITGQLPSGASRCHAAVLKPALSCPAARVSSATSHSFIYVFNALCKQRLVYFERHIPKVDSSLCSGCPFIAINYYWSQTSCVFVQGLGILCSPMKVMLQLSTSYYNMARCALQPGYWKEGFFVVLYERAAGCCSHGSNPAGNAWDTPVSACPSNPTWKHTRVICIRPMVTSHANVRLTCIVPDSFNVKLPDLSLSCSIVNYR